MVMKLCIKFKHIRFGVIYDNENYCRKFGFLGWSKKSAFIFAI